MVLAVSFFASFSFATNNLSKTSFVIKFVAVKRDMAVSISKSSKFREPYVLRSKDIEYKDTTLESSVFICPSILTLLIWGEMLK